MRWLLIVGLVAGCGVLGQPVPQVARLSSEVLTVTLSDGRICRADWRAAGGTGRLDACALEYHVTEVAKPNLVRQVFSALTAELGGADYVPPMAEVVVTNTAGRAFVFASPLSAE